MRFALLVLLVMAFAACKKDKPVQTTHLDYRVTGLPDTVTLEQTDTMDINYVVEYLSGEKEQVTLQIKGLPGGMTAGFGVSVGLPTFESQLRLVNLGTPTGYYGLSIISEDTRNSRTKTIVVRVVPNPVNPAASLVGQYTESGPCLISGTLNNTVTVTEVLPLFNKLRIIRLWNDNPSTVLFADINPDSQTIQLPPQSVNSASYSGSGTYTGTQILLNYKVDYGLGMDSCSVVLDKQ